MHEETSEVAKTTAVSTALILEDEQVVARTISRFLKPTIVSDVGLAETAAEALAAIEENRPDMVIVDIKLGAGQPDGIHFLREARRRGYTGLAIVLSGDRTPEQLFRAAWAGANDYIVKGELNMTSFIKRVLERRRDYSEVEWQHKAVLELSYLRSWGLSEHEIIILERWVELGLPRYGELAARLGKSLSAVKTVFRRIRTTLELDSLQQLARVLTTFAYFQQSWQVRAA